MQKGDQVRMHQGLFCHLAAGCKALQGYLSLMLSFDLNLHTVLTITQLCYFQHKMHVSITLQSMHEIPYPSLNKYGFYYFYTDISHVSFW